MKDRAEPRLTVDPAAAARRISGGELEGPWQVPAELVRRAFRAGATRVAVSCDRRGFRVRDDGPPLDAGTLDTMARVRSRSTTEEALVRLETGPHAELRFLAALPGASVEVTCRAGVSVVVRGLRWDHERASDWLRSVGRFAAASIELSGRPLVPHLPRGLAREPLACGWPGELALLQTGQDGAIWLVADRMVSAFLIVPGGLPFEAVVDLSAAGPRSAAALRDAIAPAIPGLIDQAARMTRDLARSVSTLDPAAAARVRVLLLKAARLPRWRGDVLRARAYPGRVRSRDTWLSLADLGSPELAGADRRVPACAPEDVSASLFLAEVPAAVLASPERGRLSQELGLRFRMLPRAERGSAGTWRTSLTTWIVRAHRLLPSGKPLRDDRLDPAERDLLDVLRRVGAAEGLDVAFCSGEGGSRRRDRVLLPRAAPAVRAAVGALARDPRWAFPATAALLGLLGTVETRSHWRRLAGDRLEGSGGVKP